MPQLSKVVLSNFRNIGSASFEPSPFINIITGANGAGKTSLLESLSVLAHGKSFRTHKYRSLIREECQDFTIFARLLRKDGDIPLGIQRSRSGEFKIKINERTVSSAAELASTIPLLCINSNSFKLIEGSPKERRRFFDWLVFHVKHEFSYDWKALQKCIKQRNSLLRRGKIQPKELEPWDIEIVRLGERIHSYRSYCFDKLSAAMSGITDVEGILPEGAKKLSIEYESGWKTGDECFRDQLQKQLSKDLVYGYTSIGPHKADIKIRFGKSPAQDSLSRGQQKLLITSLYLAEAIVFREERGENPIFAIDDLPSELDIENQKKLGRWVSEFNCQVFASGIDEAFVENTWPIELTEDKVKVFHVKHGELFTQC